MVQVRELIYREILEYHPAMLAGLPAGRQSPAQLHVPQRRGQLQAAVAQLESSGPQRGMGMGNLGQAGTVALCMLS